MTDRVVRPTLVRVDPGADDMQPRRCRSERIKVQAFLGSSCSFGPAAEIEQRLRGMPREDAAVGSGHAELPQPFEAHRRGFEGRLRAPDPVEQRSQVRLAQCDSLDAAQLLGNVQALLEQGQALIDPSPCRRQPAEDPKRQGSLPCAIVGGPGDRERLACRLDGPFCVAGDQPQPGKVCKGPRPRPRRWRLGDQPDCLGYGRGCCIAISCLPQVPAHALLERPARTGSAIGPLAANAMARRPSSTAAR